MGKLSKQERARKYADGAKEAVRLAAIQEALASGAVGRLTKEIEVDLDQLDGLNTTLSQTQLHIKELQEQITPKQKLLEMLRVVSDSITLDLGALAMTLKTTAEKLGMDLSKLEVPEDAVLETESLSRAEKAARELAVEATVINDEMLTAETALVTDDIPMVGPGVVILGSDEVERKKKVEDAPMTTKDPTKPPVAEVMGELLGIVPEPEMTAEEILRREG